MIANNIKIAKKTWQNRKLMLATACCVIFIMVPFILLITASKLQPADKDQNMENVKRSFSHTEQPWPDPAEALRRAVIPEEQRWETE